MSQTIKGSTWEAITNVLIGFWINFIANLILLPLFGFSALTAEKNLVIGIIYTAISLIRSFALRRIFNNIRSHHA